MASFGSFEPEQEVYSGTEYTVYSARKAGDPQTEYAVKVFAIRAPGVDAESAEVLGPLLRDLENTFTERVALQARAAEASQYVAPVFETGRDERGVWYATRFYARSVNQLVTRKVEISAAALKHIVSSIIQGALEIKQICGRSHGEISPMNVQLSKADLDEAEVVLSDPLPGSPAEAFRYEKADLRAIGEIIYQLVMRKGKVDFEWLILPLEATPEWAAMFGRESPKWLGLCSRLLDHNLSLEKINLEALAAELKIKGKAKR